MICYGRAMTRSEPIPRGRRLALAVLCAGTLMTIVDETVVSVALPSIQRDLRFATSDLSWVVDAYLVSFGGVITATLGWRWVFFINVPVGVLTVAAGRRVLARESGPGLAAGADLTGALLLVGGLMLGIVGIVEAGARAAGLVGIALLAAFV